MNFTKRLPKEGAWSDYGWSVSGDLVLCCFHYLSSYIQLARWKCKWIVVVVADLCPFSGADPEIFHRGWLSGWLPVLYYTELWGVAGKQ